MPTRKKILVVDDEPDLRAIARLRLENEGYEVTTVENGRKGIESLTQSRPDLVILDLMMPEMNGIEFCRRMIDDLGMKDLPILLISAVNEKAGIVRQFFQLPIERHSFIAKPVDPDQISEEVQKLIGASGLAGGPSQTSKPRAAEPPPAPKPATPPPQAQPATLKQPERAPEPPPKLQPVAAGPRLRILVIDDEEDIRTLLKTALSLRHQVETAENGMAALSIIDRVNPDFIISDINMPVMNGLETIEAIRRHPSFGAVPVFFLTAETDTNLPRKTFDLGGNLYLRKPLDPMRLLTIIDRFVQDTGLKPKPAVNGQPAPSTGAAAPKPAASTAAVRVLTIDYSATSMARMKAILGDGGGGKWETIWAEDVRLALGNLVRWEPDVIFYNPRNPGMDGIAFGQTLKLRKMASKYQIAFIGSKFYDADKEYSRRTFGRDVIDMEVTETEIKSRIFEAIDTARKSLSPKQAPLSRILAEDTAHRRAIQAQRNKKDLEREVFRERFSKLQEFIDKTVMSE